MNQGRYVFTQICDFLPRDQFEWFVKKYDGNKYVKSFTCWNHLLVMMFGQLTNRESLRDLIGSLNAHKSKFHHLGFGASVTRSNLSKANETRDVKIFEDMANLMIKTARKKRFDTDYAGIDDFLDGNVYAFDSSTISLCLSVFWWSKLHHDKGGVKLHTLYDVKTDIPAFVIITNADIHDSKVMSQIPYEKGSFYVFDRAYMDTRQLRHITDMDACFVVREKRSMKYTVVEDKNYNNSATGVMADQGVRFDSAKTKKQYEDTIRRVVFYDKEGNRTFVFYTNNMDIEAEDVARLYLYRWRVELFFKWMKQHLRIKEFYGTSENAVKIQIYVAIITYCLVAIVEHDMRLEMDTYELLRILSFSVIDKIHLADLLREHDAKPNYQNVTTRIHNLF